MSYEFESKNAGTVRFEVTDVYDGGEAEGMFADLMEHGIEFESNRSLWFNVIYVAEIMLDGDGDTGNILERLDRMTDDELAEWREEEF